MEVVILVRARGWSKGRAAMSELQSVPVSLSLCQGRAEESYREDSRVHAAPPSTLPPHHPCQTCSFFTQHCSLLPLLRAGGPSYPRAPPHPLSQRLSGVSVSSNPPARGPLQIKLCFRLPNLKGGPSTAELGDSPDPQLGSALQCCSGRESSTWLLASAGAKQPGSRRPASTTKHWGKLRVCSRGRTQGQMLAAACPAPVLPEGLILQDAQPPSSSGRLQSAEWCGEAGREK